MRNPFLVTLALLVSLAAPAARAAEPPTVVVSILPLHGLVAAVMQGAGTPGLLVPPGTSPHGYALRPSDARALDRARLVVWIGPAFEPWLERPLAGAKRAERLTAQTLPGLTLRPTREGGVWEAHHHPGEADHDHEHDHEEEEVDGHLWLDPANAVTIVEAVAERLAALDPERAALYAANAKATRARLDSLDASLAARLAPVAGRAYVVFHDAHQYFEARYHLSPAGSITVDPDRPPGARRLAQLRERLKASGAACVFGEPRSGGTTVELLARAAQARVGRLDPEGLALTPGPEAYFTLMRDLGESLAECLSGG